MQKVRIFRNAGMVVAQVVVSGIVLLILFYFLLRTIGAVQVGIWSVVLATASAARLSELGLSGGVVKFVAQYLARPNQNKAGDVVETAALSIAALIGIVLIPAYPLIGWLLKHILPIASLSEALALLPFALASLWITAIGSVFLSGLDGIQRIDIRSLVLMASAGIYLALVVMLVPSHGLVGLAYAQVTQAIIIAVVSWLLLRRLLPTLPVFPYRWNRELFRGMFSYGLNFQFSSLVQMMLDPMTKALLSKFGGLDAVSYFEMANRMVLQFRSLLVSGNQVIVPVVAGMHEANPARIPNLYRDSYSLLLFLALPIYGGVVAAIPIISELWIGRYEASFVSFATLLTVGWFSNTLAGPAYFSNLGTGRLRWNTLSHVTMGLVNGVMGTMLGIMFGSIGVVIGFVTALFLGSSLVVIAYHMENRMVSISWLPRDHWRLAIASTFAAGVGWGIYYFFRDHGGILLVGFLSTMVFVGLVIPAMWMHPLRSMLIARIIGQRGKANRLR